MHPTSPPPRQPSASDIAAAIRGLGLTRRDDAQLEATRLAHATGPFAHMFASHVIVAACELVQARRADVDAIGVR